jgi:uncharacterized protein YndB with AHSA1/START domain
MVRSTESVVVALPPAEVFRYVADLRNEPLWHVDVASVPGETDPGAGCRKDLLDQVQAVHGQDRRHPFTALEVEPGARVVYRADFAGLQPRNTYTVEPAGEGARFTRTVEMRPGGLKMLMTPMMAFMVPRRNKVFVENLKRALGS